VGWLGFIGRMVGIQDMWPEELRFRNEVVGDILIQVDLSPHCSKSRVPAVYPTSAHSLFLAFFAFNEINNLRLISQAQNSDSPHVHHFVDRGPCRRSGSI